MFLEDNTPKYAHLSLPLHLFGRCPMSTVRTLSVGETNAVHHPALLRHTNSHVRLVVKTIKQCDGLQGLFSE